ncbi:MAG TPA: RDD family protein [Acidimicrobiales bacterium]
MAGWILEERLGSGGYGEVWRARRRHVDLYRALKLIPIVSEDAFESWRHEIGRLEALSHPNVVRFYDADIVSEGAYSDYAWIATELCERSLADELRDRADHALNGGDCERLLDEMLAALAAAHTGGVVHRDLKPANIVQHRSGAWKLADFGTARLVPSDATHPITRIIGTSPYMSPAAHHGHQNHAADLYALGVTVHEALCGLRLHPRAEGMTDSEYVKFILDTPPVVSPGLPRRWRTAVEALIGVYGDLDATALAEWFTRTRGSEPPEARPRAVAVAPIDGPAPPSTAATSAATGTKPTEVRVPTRSTVQVHVPAPAVAGSGSKAARGPVRKPERRRPPPPRPAPVAPAVQPAVRSWNGGSGQASPLRPTPAPVRWAPQPQRAWPGQPWSAAAPPADPTAAVGRRVLALVVDGLVVSVLAAIVLVFMVRSQYDVVATDVSGSDPCAVAAPDAARCVAIGRTVYVSDTGPEPEPIAATIVVLLVFVVLQGLTGATPGKVLFGIRVVGPNGKRPGVGRALLRTVAWVVDAFPWVFPVVGLVLIGTTPGHKRVGDMVAGTSVIKRPRVGTPQVVYLPAAPGR